VNEITQDDTLQCYSKTVKQHYTETVTHYYNNITAQAEGDYDAS